MNQDSGCLGISTCGGCDEFCPAKGKNLVTIKLKSVTVDITPSLEQLLLQFLHTDTMATNRPIFIVRDRVSICMACDPECDGKRCISERDIAFFFSKEEARKYRRYQRHNLNDPYIMAHSPGYGNEGDYEPFYDLLRCVAKKLERSVSSG